MRFLTFLLMLMAAPAMAAEWTVGAAPSDDPTMQAATITNDDGHALFLWARHADQRYQVFAEFHLGRGEAFGSAMPTYRIDGGEITNTRDIRDKGDELGALWAHASKDAAFWLVWTSIQDTILPSDDLHAWFVGETIEIGYVGPDGTPKTTVFPLSGVAAALQGATGIKTQ